MSTSTYGPNRCSTRWRAATACRSSAGRTAYSPPLVRTGAYAIGAEGELERTLLSYEEELRATAAIG